MRPLEIALLLVSVPLLLWCLSGRALPAWGRGLALVALAVMIAHLLFEGGRWHLIPGYLVTVGLAAAACWPYTLVLGRTAGVLGLLLLVGSALVASVLPVFTLPEPTGAIRSARSSCIWWTPRERRPWATGPACRAS